MPKLSQFRQALRSAEAAHRYALSRVGYNHYPEAVTGYQAESHDMRIVRIMKKGHAQRGSKFPKGALK